MALTFSTAPKDGLFLGVLGRIPNNGSIFLYSLGTKNKVGSTQNKIPENSKSLTMANPSVKNTDSGNP